MTTPSEPREIPFWTYEDLALFIGSVLPVLLIAKLFISVIPVASTAARALAYQALIYALLLGALYFIVAVRYGQPFWRSLGWKPFRYRFWCALGGPLLAIASSSLGVALRAPSLPSPIKDLVSDRRSLFVMMLFLTIIGPVFEEITFRG